MRRLLALLVLALAPACKTAPDGTVTFDPEAASLAMSMAQVEIEAARMDLADYRVLRPEAEWVDDVDQALNAVSLAINAYLTATDAGEEGEMEPLRAALEFALGATEPLVADEKMGPEIMLLRGILRRALLYTE